MSISSRTLHCGRKFFPCRNPANESSWAIKSIKNACSNGLPAVPADNFIPQNSTMPDIYPGRFNPLPYWKGKRVVRGTFMSPPAGAYPRVAKNETTGPTKPTPLPVPLLAACLCLAELGPEPPD